MEGRFPFPIVHNILIGEEVPCEDDDINIGELILHALKLQPNFVAQVNATNGREITFQEIKNKSVQLAMWMRILGIQAGDIIGISSSHCAVMYVFFACLYIGAIPALWHENHTFATTRDIISTDTKKMIFIDDTVAFALYDNIIEMETPPKVIVFGLFNVFIPYDDIDYVMNIESSQKAIDNFICEQLDKSKQNTAAILYTRSSYKTIKRVNISHATFMAAVNQQVFDMLPAGIGMWVGSLSSLTNLIFAVQSIFSSKRMIRFIGYWKQGICQAIQEYKINWVLLETYMCKEIVESNLLERYNFSFLEMLIFTGSTISYKNHRKLIELLPETSIVSLYGTAETGIISYYTRSKKFRSSGYIGKNVCVKIVDLNTGKMLGPNTNGEIACICEYNRSLAFKRKYQIRTYSISTAWHFTGDIGYYNENGEVFVTERKADYIFSGGEFFSPDVIENVIRRYSAIEEVAVVTTRNYEGNRYPIAYITTKPGKKINMQSMVREVRNKLCDHMQLRGGAALLHEMPRKLDGTIDRFSLREDAFYRVSISQFI